MRPDRNRNGTPSRMDLGTPLTVLYGFTACGLLVALLLLAGCQSGDRGSTAGSAAAEEPVTLSWSHLEPAAGPEFTAELEARGGVLFADNCASCHGEKGDGKGVCAPFLLPQPRDFTSGTYRFKSTPGNEMPTDQDLFRTVSIGLHGTGMPPWRFLLPEEDLWALVAHVKTLSPYFEEYPAPPGVDLGAEPATVTAENIERGKQLYRQAECGKCHGDEGYGDGLSAPTLVDTFGYAISPRNFHKPSQFKRGHTLRDLALTIRTGNNGTPMPAYGDAFTPEQTWDLAAYVLSLGERQLDSVGSPAAASAGEHLGEPDVVIKLMERHWRFVPDVIRVRQGQVVRIDFQPTDNGLGVGHGFAIDGYDKSAFINGAMVQRPKSVTFLADRAGTFTFYCATQCSTGGLHPKMNGTLVVEPAS